MSDVIADLRRLAEKMAQEPLEHAEGHFESIDEMVTYFADVASQRPEHLFLHVVQSVDSVDDGGDGIIAITGNGFLSNVHADVFVAVQRYLPALLDAIDTLSWYADERNYIIQWTSTMTGGSSLRTTANAPVLRSRCWNGAVRDEQERCCAAPRTH